MDAAGALCEEDSSSWDGAHNETRQAMVKDQTRQNYTCKSPFRQVLRLGHLLQHFDKAQRRPFQGKQQPFPFCVTSEEPPNPVDT